MAMRALRCMRQRRACYGAHLGSHHVHQIKVRHEVCLHGRPVFEEVLPVHRKRGWAHFLEVEQLVGRDARALDGLVFRGQHL